MENFQKTYPGHGPPGQACASSLSAPMPAMYPNEPQKRSKRERLRAKVEEFFHKNHGKDDSTPTPAGAPFSANDKEDLVKKVQDLLNKKKDQNGSEEMKKENGGLGALGALGPVAYEMWKKRKEKKKRQRRRRRNENDGGESWVEVEEEVEEEESEEESEEEEEEEGEGGSGFQDFLTWIQDVFND